MPPPVCFRLDVDLGMSLFELSATCLLGFHYGSRKHWPDHTDHLNKQQNYEYKLIYSTGNWAHEYLWILKRL